MVGGGDLARGVMASVERCVQSERRHQTHAVEQCSDGAEASRHARWAIVTDPTLQMTYAILVVGPRGWDNVRREPVEEYHSRFDLC